MDDETTGFVLLLEDLGGLDAGNQIEGLPIPRVQRVLDGLAEFHAWGWPAKPESACAQQFPALNDPATHGLYSVGVPAGWATYRKHGRIPVPGRFEAFVDEFAQHLPGLLELVSEPQTLLNGDLRVDNLFFDAADNPRLVDFQLVCRGAGIWDVAYWVGQGMTAEQRAKSRPR